MTWTSLRVGHAEGMTVSSPRAGFPFGGAVELTGPSRLVPARDRPAPRPSAGGLRAGRDRRRRRPAPGGRQRPQATRYGASPSRCWPPSWGSRSGARSWIDHHMGVDTIALIAMVGSLALGEELAGVVVGLMFSGGAALEDVASTRARRELTALIERAPKVAQRRVGDRLEEVPVDRVSVGRRRGRAHRRGRAGRRRRSSAARPWSTQHADRRAAAGDDRRAGALSSAARRTPAPRSTCARRGPRPRAPTPRSSGSCSRRRPSARRSCGWPTATPASSCRPRSCSRPPRGRSAATRCARSPSSWSRRRAR